MVKIESVLSCAVGEECPTDDLSSSFPETNIPLCYELQGKRGRFSVRI